MSNGINLAFISISFCMVMCQKAPLTKASPTTILMDTELLVTTKSRIKKKDPQIIYAFDKLIEEADDALNKGPFSVTDKEKLPPSGDMHDYASYSRYWWPDPSQANGLPYIRRDGETYPQSQSEQESDRLRIGAFSHCVEALGLAYYFTENQKYAKKAAKLLRVWFLDAATRMNPNVNHAQIRPGHNEGTKSGVLDGRLLIRALEGALLISDSSEWNESDQHSLKKWVTEYFRWLTSSKMGLQEAASENNHGSYYDVQAMYFALFSGQQTAATQIAQQFVDNRIHKQIQPNGSMPKEIARTRPLFYSLYNLNAMFLMAKLAEQVDVDIWQSDDEHSRLRAALDYLVPYTDPEKPWPSPTAGVLDRSEFYAILKMADRVYPDRKYLEMTEKIPVEKCRTLRVNVALPLMR